jgi:hypothetical protein
VDARVAVYPAAVRLRVGPLPSAGVSLWIAYARTVITRSLVRPAELGVSLSPEVVELVETYLDDWERAASAGAVFEWGAEVPTDQITSLGGTWFLIASHLAEVAEQRGYPISPPEGDEFYRALIMAFLDGLDAEGGHYAAMADELRAEWPGLKVDES